MPEQRVTKEMVLDAALALVREQGEGPLSARAIAERTGCSVQPIYSLFGDMQELVRQLYDYARRWVVNYNRQNRDLGKNAFEANGFAHLRLAQTEAPLFRFLYLSPHMNAQSFEDVYQSVALVEVERCIEDLGHLSPSAAHELYLNMIVYTHGMATLLTCGMQFDDEELRTRLDVAFRGFVSMVR